MLASSTSQALGARTARPSCTGRIAPALPLTRHRQLIVRQNKFGDDLMDYVTAGPKLRKWYGAGERPTDGGPEDGKKPEKEPEVEEPPSGEVVVVTEADSPIGEQVVLQLILARQELKVLVRDVAAAKNAYGPYTTPLPAEAVAASPAKALRGAKALVLLGKPPKGLLEAAKAARVGHVVLLAAGTGAAAGAGGFSLGGFSLGGGSAARELRDLGDEAAEVAVRGSGIPYSVVQVHGLTEQGRGATAGVAVARATAAAAGGGGKRGGVSREALGAVVSGIVDSVPTRGRTLQAQAAGGGGSALELQEAIAAAVEVLAEDA